MRASEYALRFIGVPYIHGGNTPNPGLDCSGLACEVARAMGYIPKLDLDAQGLYDYLMGHGWGRDSNAIPTDGAFLFFGKDITDISHVAIAYGHGDMVEAAGAGEECKTVEMAAKLGAFVRVRPIKWRRDLVVAIIPTGSIK